MAQSVGIKDVARVAGVSVGTVSNVINRPDTVAAETRARVLSAIDRLGYVRSESARQLRAGRSRIMGLLVLDMGNPFFVDVAGGGGGGPGAPAGGDDPGIEKRRNWCGGGRWWWVC
ncbi:LacI family DNA-binding transcriptional regulator, partial [Streptomyces griseoflavus]|uniref:LacI family DNA-binding transcriptional regulator n=1 Tax=Streptomyces griseoflavus TaxID=35619 RepID=UPI0033AA21A0